jgi:hypothetical protein
MLASSPIGTVQDGVSFMRKGIFLLLVGSVLSVAHADDTIQIPWGNKFFQPKETPPVIIHDFGAVPKGTVLTKRFQITNLYAVPMQIMDVRVSCGCVTPAVPERVLQPRQGGFVDVQMDSSKFEGHKAVSVWVDFGPNFRSSGILQVRAFSRTDVTLTPGKIDYGVLPQGSTPYSVVEVAYTGNVPNWQITGVAAAEALSVKAEIIDVGKQANARIYQVRATLKPNATPGSLQETIQLQTNDPNNPIIPISVSAVLLAPYTVRPNFIQFDNVKVGEDLKSSRVIIQGTKPFVISKVEGETNGLKVNFRNNPQQIQVVEIKFEPTLPGKSKAQLKLTTDQNEIIVIPVELSVLPGKPSP